MLMLSCLYFPQCVLYNIFEFQITTIITCGIFALVQKIQISVIVNLAYIKLTAD